MKTYQEEDLRIFLQQGGFEEDGVQRCMDQMAGWMRRGDGVAIYENMELGHPNLGHRKYVSYGSSAAQLEPEHLVDKLPPQRLPDIGGIINWRYQLIGVVPPTGEL